MDNPAVPALDPEEDDNFRASELDFPIVGIGASAGGLMALIHLFEHMPHDTGMAFVIILHLSPTHESHSDEILQRNTKMPVMQVTETVPIEPNHIYIISPAMQLSMNDGHLTVSDLERSGNHHVAIDLFFRTLAHVHKERAIAIVLSGSGSDGAVGLTRIKEQGGITFAQNVHDAEHDGMPRNAIATGLIDFILPVVEMPQKLIDLWQNARKIELPN
ncbi:MAG TPA: chemotaxis protein CheB, partial [Rhodocyclaceae bacterium]|nr:chemotaxis protein CheB [Rhodocyclaceae bacterium]